jgi:NAD-dependent SIR2 family protein deacetylase
MVIHLHGQLNQNCRLACNELHGILKDDIDEIDRIYLMLAEDSRHPDYCVPPAIAAGLSSPDITWFGERLPKKAGRSGKCTCAAATWFIVSVTLGWFIPFYPLSTQ